MFFFENIKIHVQVAAMCRDKMHVLMEDELMRVEYTPVNESGGSGPQVLEEDCWRRAMRRCFERMDEVAMTTCVCGSLGNQCGCHPLDMALTGSTALVAVVTAEQIVVANCGDSRAVLSRAGRPIPLSFDQKVSLCNVLAFGGGHVLYNFVICYSYSVLSSRLIMILIDFYGSLIEQTRKQGSKLLEDM